VKYTAKKATKKWLEGAPDYVLCIYDHPDFADRYTIVFGGKMQEGDGTFAGAWLPALGTSESGHVSGSIEFKAWELGTYRTANYHRQIRWRDLPLGVRLRARYWAEIDMPHDPDEHKKVLKIGAEENSLLDRIGAAA